MTLWLWVGLYLLVGGIVAHICARFGALGGSQLKLEYEAVGVAIVWPTLVLVGATWTLGRLITLGTRSSEDR